MGQCLVVSVTQDRFVNKGPNRPVFNLHQRCEMLRELRCVDEVIGVRDALQALMLVMPDVFVKGSEYLGKLCEEDMLFCVENKIDIAFTDEPRWSSTRLLSHYAGL